MSNIYRAKGINLARQYADVGRLFKNYLNQPIEIEQKKMKLVERVLANVRGNPALNIFYKCFAAWARGAAISEERAMYLLADNTSGCQTALVRYKSGVALLHTEEDYYDVAARMSGEHTIEFGEGGRSLKCLTYNDLMPGAGLYGWQKDMLVAVDSLFLSEVGIDEIERPMLANIIAWLIWYEKPTTADPERLVKKLKAYGTVIDGYAVNVALKNDNGIGGYKLTFARDEWEVERLGDEVGANLRQVNIVEPSYARQRRPVARYRHAPWKMGIDYYGFLKRLRQMQKHIVSRRPQLAGSLRAEDVPRVHQAVQNLVFEQYREDYVSEWMGAMCVGLVDQIGTSVSTRLKEARLPGELEYLDLV